MGATDALTITSAPDALTRYYDAKEREESAVLYINDAYLEVLNSLESLEAENAKLRELIKDLYEDMWASGEWLEPYEQRMRELGVETDA